MPADRSDAACTVAGVRKRMIGPSQVQESAVSQEDRWQHIVVVRLLDEVAHRHVFDHAPAQGLMGLSLIGVLLS